MGEVDVLATLGLAVAAAQDVHGEEHRTDDQDGTDDDGYCGRADRPGPGRRGNPGRVPQDDGAESAQQECDAEFRALAHLLL